MKRRSFIKSSIGLGLSWSGVQAAERAEQPENRSTVPERHPLKPNPAPSDKPHILLIMTDQQRGDALGCMGNPYIITPHLDQLAAEGTLFVCGYTSTPSSTPARSGLLTGLSP